MKFIIKRDGSEKPFDINKINIAIRKANESVKESFKMSEEQVLSVVENIKEKCDAISHSLNVEEIQDMVEEELVRSGAAEVVRSYIKYRYTRELLRKANTTDEKILSLINCNNEEAKYENSNKNPVLASTQRDYIAGEVSRDLTNRLLLPKEIVDAHNAGIIHFHDADYYAQNIFNCCLLNLEDMLQNGTVISGTLIEKPHSFSTACNIATQIIAQVASNQYGGQTITLSHLAPFVEVSRKKIRKQVEQEVETAFNSLPYEYVDSYVHKEDVINEITENRVKEEIKRGVQTIQYQVVTLMTTNGQAPFLSVNMYLNEAKNEQEKADLALIIEEVLKQRIQGVKNSKGVWIAPAFPKLLYVLQEDNIEEGTPYFYLTKLAAECTAKRMVPDYISEKVMKSLKINKDGTGDCYPCMGCRSFLTPWRTKVDRSGALNHVEEKYYGRFNQGVVSINLVDVGLSADKDMEKFWKIFEERLELCHRALRCRHERLATTVSDTSPIHWQHGAIARLKPGESIEKLLFDGYSTISLGYAGLWECVYSLIGKKLTEKEGKELGLKIMQKMNDKCNEWKAAENIDYSLYGTPIESTTYKFAKSLQNRFGIIKGVTDKNYITNSYHVHVTEPINAFDKLKLESEFQKLSPGGAISYVEVPDMKGNIDAVISVIQYIYDNIMYAELNTKSDYCQVCGFDGEIKIVNDGEKLVWECPNCGNRDQSKLNVARRTCGYIGTQFWNQGRTQEIKERVLHL